MVVRIRTLASDAVGFRPQRPPQCGSTSASCANKLTASFGVRPTQMRKSVKDIAERLRHGRTIKKKRKKKARAVNTPATSMTRTENSSQCIHTSSPRHHRITRRGPWTGRALHLSRLRTCQHIDATTACKKKAKTNGRYWPNTQVRQRPASQVNAKKKSSATAQSRRHIACWDIVPTSKLRTKHNIRQNLDSTDLLYFETSAIDFTITTTHQYPWCYK